MIIVTEENYNFFTAAKKNIAANKNIIISIGKILIAVGLVSYLLFAINFSEIIQAIKNADLFLLSLVLLLGILNIYLQFYKWELTTKTVLQEGKSKKIFYSLLYGFSAGLFTPARIGEYFGRAIVFKDKSLLQVTLATLLDKLFPFFIVTFIGSISSLLFIHEYYKISVYITLSLFILLFALFYFIFWLIFNDSFWNTFLFGKLQSSQKMQRIYEKIKILRNLDKKYSTTMLFVSLLFYLCFLAQYALLVMAFSHHNNFQNYLIAGNLVMFSKTIIPPISFGELGIREGASVFFITMVGESATTGFNASIFLFLINILIPSLVGLILLMRNNVE